MMALSLREMTENELNRLLAKAHHRIMVCAKLGCTRTASTVFYDLLWVITRQLTDSDAETLELRGKMLEFLGSKEVLQPLVKCWWYLSDLYYLTEGLKLITTAVETSRDPEAILLVRVLLILAAFSGEKREWIFTSAYNYAMVAHKLGVVNLISEIMKLKEPSIGPLHNLGRMISKEVPKVEPDVPPDRNRPDHGLVMDALKYISDNPEPKPVYDYVHEIAEKIVPGLFSHESGTLLEAIAALESTNTSRKPN